MASSSSYSDDEINEEQIKYASGEYDVEVVRRLALPEVGLMKISGLSRCTQLVSLDLSSNRIRLIQGLDELVMLERLDLSLNAIERIGDGLNTLQALDYLDLHANSIFKLDIDIKQLPLTLSFLNLEENPCSQDPDYSSLIISSLPNLQCLDNERLVLKSEREKLHRLLDSIKPDQPFLSPLPPQSWINDLLLPDSSSSSSSQHTADTKRLLDELDRRAKSLDSAMSQALHTLP